MVPSTESSGAVGRPSLPSSWRLWRRPSRRPTTPTWWCVNVWPCAPTCLRLECRYNTEVLVKPLQFFLTYFLSTKPHFLMLSARCGSRTGGPSFARSRGACRRSSFRSRRRRLERQRVCQQMTPKLTWTAAALLRPPCSLKRTLLRLLPPPPPATQKPLRSPSLGRWVWRSTSPPPNRPTASRQRRTERRTKWERTREWRRRGKEERKRTGTPCCANGWTLHQVNIWLCKIPNDMTH